MTVTVTHARLLAAASANGWEVGGTPTRVSVKRGAWSLQWQAAGAVKSNLWIGDDWAVDLRPRSRAAILALLEDDHQSVPQLLQDTLNGTVVRVDAPGVKILQPAQNAADQRMHLCGDHGLHPMAISPPYFQPSHIDALHETMHRYGQPTKWPYVNAHHHVDLSAVRVSDLTGATT